MAVAREPTRFLIIGTALLAMAALAPISGATRAAAAPLSDKEVGEKLRVVFLSGPEEHRAALDVLVKRGKPDIMPALVLASRYRRRGQALEDAMFALTGERLGDWYDAMLWQEAHPEVKPHPSFRGLKLELLEQIDPAFMRFLGGERSDPDKLKIRLEEIVWGGVGVDGIPSLDNPKLIGAAKADYLRDDDLVFGVAINGDVRAYPLRIMGWHEMFNETIGGVPVALAYCTLCGAGILFETHVAGRDKPLVFGSSGFLYRSNKLMFDRETDSLWNQFTGKPVSGPLLGSGIELKTRPVAITSWKDWRAQNPGTRVLSVTTGYRRDYGSGVVYKSYFASADLMFPTAIGDESTVRRKDYVFGLRDVGAAKAWPLAAFAKTPVINDRIGRRTVVLIGKPDTRTVRAYERKDLAFTAHDKPGKVTGPGGAWSVTEEALKGPDGTSLPRLPGHVSYWFAWDGYHGIRSELYKD